MSFAELCESSKNRKAKAKPAASESKVNKSAKRVRPDAAIPVSQRRAKPTAATPATQKRMRPNATIPMHSKPNGTAKATAERVEVAEPQATTEVPSPKHVQDDAKALAAGAVVRGVPWG